jgi:hypothetical protein
MEAAEREAEQAAAPILPAPPTRRTRRREEQAALLQAIDELRGMGPCEHGEDGGDQLHPVSGQPLCPLCRRAGESNTGSTTEAPH